LNAIPPAASVDEARVIVAIGVVVPRPRRFVLLLKKKLELSCVIRPEAVAKRIEPVVSPVLYRLVATVRFVVEAREAKKLVVEALVAAKLPVAVALVKDVLARVVRPATFKVPDEVSPVVEALPRVV
jgi:hypothetical protein